jgi:hypothetical protein
MIDLTLPLEQLPEEVAFDDLPPVAQALVRRNVVLREKLSNLENALRDAEEKIECLQKQRDGA